MDTRNEPIVSFKKVNLCQYLGLTPLSTAQGADFNFTRNFYWFGHGEPMWIGNKLSGSDEVKIKASDVGAALGNGPAFVTPQGILIQHPYRFVFLDGCETQSAKAWALAFGMPTTEWDPEKARANSQKARAILGFTDDVAAIGPNQATQSYVYTLEAFFYLWQGGDPLNICLTNCNTKIALQQTFNKLGFVPPIQDAYLIPIGMPQAPFYHNEGTLQKVYGYGGITRTGIQ